MSSQVELGSEHAREPSSEAESNQEAGRPEDAEELRITVRKLEVPVRPRGVLAE